MYTLIATALVDNNFSKKANIAKDSAVMKPINKRENKICHSKIFSKKKREETFTNRNITRNENWYKKWSKYHKEYCNEYNNFIDFFNFGGLYPLKTECQSLLHLAEGQFSVESSKSKVLSDE